MRSEPIALQTSRTLIVGAPEGLDEYQEEQAGRRPRDSIAAFFHQPGLDSADANIEEDEVEPQFYQPAEGYDPELEDQSMMSIEEPSSSHNDESMDENVDIPRDDTLHGAAFRK